MFHRASAGLKFQRITTQQRKGRWVSRQSPRIAQLLNEDLGTATITHPFHPLNGKTFTILKIRRNPTGRSVSLLTDDDIFCVPESWIKPIDEDESIYSPFNADVLRSLLDFSKIYKNDIDNSKIYDTILL